MSLVVQCAHFPAKILPAAGGLWPRRTRLGRPQVCHRAPCGNWFGPARYMCAPAPAPASSPTSTAVTLRPDRAPLSKHIGRCVCARALTLITRRIVSASVLQSCRRTDACSSAYSVICETLHTHIPHTLCNFSALASTAPANRVRHLDTPRANVLSAAIKPRIFSPTPARAP